MVGTNWVLFFSFLFWLFSGYLLTIVLIYSHADSK